VVVVPKELASSIIVIAVSLAWASSRWTACSSIENVNEFGILFTSFSILMIMMIMAVVVMMIMVVVVVDDIVDDDCS